MLTELRVTCVVAGEWGRQTSLAMPSDSYSSELVTKGLNNCT